jgi:hypothetical protein
MKIRPVGAELFHGDGQAGGRDMTKPIVAFVFSLLGDTPASKYYVPTFRNILLVHTTYKVGTKCSETSAHKIQTPENHPKERIQHSEHSKSWKSRLTVALSNFVKAPKSKSKLPCLGVPFGLPDVPLQQEYRLHARVRFRPSAASQYSFAPVHTTVLLFNPARCNL